MTTLKTASRFALTWLTASAFLSSLTFLGLALWAGCLGKGPDVTLTLCGAGGVAGLVAGGLMAADLATVKE